MQALHGMSPVVAKGDKWEINICNDVVGDDDCDDGDDDHSHHQNT